MNKEIKKMLEQMKIIAITGKDKNGIKVDGYGLQQNGLKILLDYITNLQQENGMMRKLIDEGVENSYKKLKKLENIRKEAIEYIKHAQNYGTMAQVMPHLKPYVNGDDLLNILQGSDKE